MKITWIQPLARAVVAFALPLLSGVDHGDDLGVAGNPAKLFVPRAFVLG